MPAIKVYIGTSAEYEFQSIPNCKMIVHDSHTMFDVRSVEVAPLINGHNLLAGDRVLYALGIRPQVAQLVFSFEVDEDTRKDATSYARVVVRLLDGISAQWDRYLRGQIPLPVAAYIANYGGGIYADTRHPLPPDPRPQNRSERGG